MPEERGEGDNEGEKGKDQRTCINDPQTRTTGWGLTVVVGAGRGRGE